MGKQFMFVSDLDGTLFRSDHSCSQKDYRALLDLGDAGHIRVIATGRSLHSAHKVLPQDFPIDYLSFSSGAGLMDWKRKKIILSHKFDSDEVIKISYLLKEQQLDFMLHYPVPENHHFVYHTSGKENIDFERRIKLYREFAEPYDFAPETFGSATQFIAIVCKNSVAIYNRLVREFTFAKIIRATSPLDHQSIWIEIFPKQVSKGLSVKFLCEYLNFNPANTISIGNDYNDIDMLEFTDSSWVVENAPDSFKKIFKVSSSNNNNGFSKMVEVELNSSL